MYFWCFIELAVNEMVPPVPPRYKRKKMNTSEDSKNTHIRKNTCGTNSSDNMKPPPRRKVKGTNKLKEQSEIGEGLKQNYKTTLEHINGIDKETVDKTVNTNLNSSFIIAKNSSTANFQELLEPKRTIQSNYEKEIIENNFKNSVEVVTNCKISVDCRNILENQISNITEDRVLDIPLEIANTSSPSCIENNYLSLDVSEVVEYNKLDTNLSEKSATIVGVFYKPEYFSQNIESKGQFTDNALSNNFGICSNDINKDIMSVTIAEPNKVDKIYVKESEENDSGVYFSDTKSPPHKGTHLKTCCLPKNNEGHESKSSCLELDRQFFNPVPANDSDTIDNKTSEDLGPPSYEKMLDYFEAQTVNTFREEMCNQFSLYTGGFQKENTEQNWLSSEDYLSTPKKSFSEYLKNMLETGDNTDSLITLDPLSIVCDNSSGSVSGNTRENEGFEENVFDILSGNLREDEQMEENETDTIDGNPLPKACFCQSSLTSYNETSELADSNNVDRSIDMNIVNNDYIRVTHSEVKNEINVNTSQITGSIDDVFNTKESTNVVLKSCKTLVTDENSKYLDIAYVSNDIGQNSIYPNCIPSPTIKHGAVISLIEYFENIQKQESDEFNYNSDEDLDIMLECEGEIDTKSIESSLDALYINEDIIINNEREFESTIGANVISHSDCVTNDKRADDELIINETLSCFKSEYSPAQCISQMECFTTKGTTDMSRFNNYKIYEGDFKEVIQNCSFDTFNSSLMFLNNVDSPFEDQTMPENISIEVGRDIEFDNHSVTHNQLKTESNFTSEVDNKLFNYVDLKEIHVSLEEDKIISDEREICFGKTNKTITNIQHSNPTNRAINDSGDMASLISKSTRIPIVVLNDDYSSNQIGSLELHPSDCAAMDRENLGKKKLL